MYTDSVDVNALSQEIQAEQFRELYNVKLMKMEQESEAVVGDLLEDTVEFSQEAMEKFLSECNCK